MPNKELDLFELQEELATLREREEANKKQERNLRAELRQLRLQRTRWEKRESVEDRIIELARINLDALPPVPAPAP